MARLNTKIVRELKASKWQFLAVGATITLGIAFFLGSLVSYSNLGKSYALTYHKLGFGDVWVRMAAAPDTLIKRIARLPGVAQVEGRNIEEVRLSLPDRKVRQVMGRLISLPAGRQPRLNRVRVVEGGYLSASGGREALLEVSFARAHNYKVGEFVYPTIAGDEIRFRVVGLVQSPEYIYSIQSEQALIPTPDTFGVVFLPEEQMERLFGTGGTINEICVTTTHPDKRRAVARLLERISDRYGGREPVTREDQPSNKLLEMDLEGYRQMAIFFPLLFLGAGILTTYTLLARIVQSQRAQIGVLRATGYTRRAVLLHYLLLALAPSLAGGLLGVAAGYGFVWLVMSLYQELMNIPYIYVAPRLDIVAAAFIIAAGAGILGALSPARFAAGLAPARAMTQESMTDIALPHAVRWLGRGLPLGLKLPLRNLGRRPRRAAYTTLGIAMGVALMLLSFALLDSVDDAIVTFFEDIERYDVSAVFATEQPGTIVSHIESWPGVNRVEATLDIPVELRRGAVTHSTVLSGLPPDSRLRRLTTVAGGRAAPGEGEVLLGAMLRKKLGAQEGDEIRIDYAENRRGFNISRRVRVGPAIEQPIGSMAYMRAEDVSRHFADRLGKPLGAASGVLIQVDAERLEWTRQRLHRLPEVAAVQTRAQTYRQIQELLRFTKAFTGILAFFGVGLAFAVVFTAVSINVLERTRELATLRTLGFGLGHIAWFTSVENLLIAAAGAVIGIPLGRWLDILLMTSSQSESMALEPVIYLRTYLISVGGVFLLCLISQIPSLARLRRLNLAAATKQLAD